MTQENKVKPNLLQRFLLYWKFKYRYYPQNFVRGVKNLIKWGPIIWKDRDWDDSFLFEIIKFKISNMSESHGKTMVYVGSQRNVEIMNTIVRLIDKFQTEHYQDEFLDYIDDEYSFVQIEGTDSFEMKTVNLRNDLDQYFAKYPLLKNRATKHPYYQENPSDTSMGMLMGKVQHDRAKRLIFELLNRNIEKWWE
jgi:hypothetical protein